MSPTIEMILEAEKNANRAKKRYLDMVDNWISENVDPLNRDTLTNAVEELPECASKLKIYDMLWELDHPKQKTKD